MESLALLVTLLFLIVVCSGPAAIASAYCGLYGSAILFSVVAAISGLHWFITASTSVRYLGLLSVVMAAFSVGFMLSHLWPK